MFKIARDEGRRIVSMKSNTKQTREDKFKVLEESKTIN